MSSFTKATREKAKLKMCLAGPSGAGKSYTAVIVAIELLAHTLGHAPSKEECEKYIAIIESEAGKINKYAGYKVHGRTWHFSVCVLSNFGPADYVNKLEEAHRAGFLVVIIDSISHEWQGKGGALETVDKVGGANKFTTGWKTVTPLHNSFIDTVLRLPVHVIATCRLKMGYVLEEITKDGKTFQAPKKVGLEPIQRNGVEYEFEIFASLDTSHIMRVEKTICPSIDGLTVVSPGPETFAPLFTWLSEGVEVKASEYRSSLVPREQLEGLMTKLRTAGVNMQSEREWILKKFGVEEFGLLSPEQFEKYGEHVKLLAFSAAQSAEKLAASVAPPTPVAESRPAPAATPVVADVHKVNGTNGTNGTHTETPIPDEAPVSYGLTPIERCKTLFEELRHALNIPAEQAPDFFRKAVLAKFNAASAKELTDAQLREVERAFMTKLRSTYRAQGKEGALSF